MANINRVKAELRSSSNNLCKREIFLVINCFWRLCQMCEQCLIWTLMLIGPAFPAFSWNCFSSRSAVSGYLFKWAFLNLEWIGFSSSERERKKRKRHFKSNKKKSSWKKKKQQKKNLRVAKVSKSISESTEMHSFESASSVKRFAAPRGTGCLQISG